MDYSAVMTKSGHCRDLKKERLKRWVFKRFQKTFSGGADVTFCGGRVFHGQWENWELNSDRKSSIADG